MVDKMDVQVPGAPKAIGPYSQAIRAGELLFISGQLPLDPASGELTAPDIEGQTRRCLENIQAIVECTGGALVSLVKTTVYLTSLSDFDLMNEVYAEYFPYQPPARSTVEVRALPKGALVEIEAIAAVRSVSDIGMT